MRPTPDQQAVLDSLDIVRLSGSQFDIDAIQNFTVREDGKSLLEYLQKYAIDENATNANAVYFVVDGDKDVLLYFSMKAGALHLHYNEQLIKEAEQITSILDNLQSKLGKDPDEDSGILWAIGQIKKRSTPLISKLKNIVTYVLKKGDKFKNVMLDRATETNANNIKVLDTFPSVEMAQFCANKTYKGKYSALFYPNTTGTVIFWHKVVPEIIRLTEAIGLKYLYIFAADSSDNKQLEAFYKSALKFKEPGELGTSKPYYDNNCTLMIQEIADLQRNRQLFYDNFNPDADSV